MQIMLMTINEVDGKNLIIPKGTVFTGLGKLELKHSKQSPGMQAIMKVPFVVVLKVITRALLPTAYYL